MQHAELAEKTEGHVILGLVKRNYINGNTMLAVQPAINYWTACCFLATGAWQLSDLQAAACVEVRSVNSPLLLDLVSPSEQIEYDRINAQACQ